MRASWLRGALALGASLVILPAGAQTGSALAVSPRPLASLAAVWDAAQAADRGLAAAAVERGMVEVRRAQQAALWEPRVQAGVMAGVGGHSTAVRGASFSAPALGGASGVAFDTSVTAGASTRALLQASRPLISAERSVQQAQLRIAESADELQWRAARDQALLRISEQYVAQALAAEHVSLLDELLASVTRSEQEARDRFVIGASPITDTHEADAALAGVRAQQAHARGQWRLAQRLLADATGSMSASPRLPARGVTALHAQTVELWVDEALQRNVGLLLQRAAVDRAREELGRHGRWSRLALDVVGELKREDLSGTGRWGHAREGATVYGVGVQLSVPLFDERSRDAGRLEAERSLLRAQAQYALAREQVEQQVRAAWLALEVQRDREEALLSAVAAGQARLDATQLGRSLGERTTQELLNAQNDLARVRLDRREALARQWIEVLRLHGLVDRLDTSTLAIFDQAAGG